jgi:hypothetical protein
MLRVFFPNHRRRPLASALPPLLAIRPHPPPIPSLATLPLFVIVLMSLSLTTSTRTFTSLVHYIYSEILSTTSVTKKRTSAWLPRALLILVLFLITRAAKLLVLLAVWELVGEYRNGVFRVTEEADRVMHCAVSASERAGEYIREARMLDMRAMQLAATVVDNK